MPALIYRYKSQRRWSKILRDAEKRPNNWMWIGWFSSKYNPIPYANKYGLTLDIHPAKNREDLVEVWAAKIV